MSLGSTILPHTAEKMKFAIKNFHSKCDKVRSFLQIWSHLLKKSLMENFIFCAVSIVLPRYTVLQMLKQVSSILHGVSSKHFYDDLYDYHT